VVTRLDEPKMSMMKRAYWGVAAVKMVTVVMI
jgi:hypothetical protein